MFICYIIIFSKSTSIRKFKAIIGDKLLLKKYIKTSLQSNVTMIMIITIIHGDSTSLSSFANHML